MTKTITFPRGFNGTAGLSGGPASLQAGFFKLFPLFAEGGGIILWIDVLGFSFLIFVAGTVNSTDFLNGRFVDFFLWHLTGTNTEEKTWI